MARPRKQGRARGLRGWHVTSIPVAVARALTGCQGPAQGAQTQPVPAAAARTGGALGGRGRAAGEARRRGGAQVPRVVAGAAAAGARLQGARVRPAPHAPLPQSCLGVLARGLTERVLALPSCGPQPLISGTGTHVRLGKVRWATATALSETSRISHCPTAASVRTDRNTYEHTHTTAPAVRAGACWLKRVRLGGGRASVARVGRRRRGRGPRRRAAQRRVAQVRQQRRVQPQQRLHLRAAAATARARQRLVVRGTGFGWAACWMRARALSARSAAGRARPATKQAPHDNTQRRQSQHCLVCH